MPRQNHMDTEGRLQSFASVAFNPLTLITGNGGFWRADAGVTGSPSVTAWADQSSFGNNLATTVGGGFSNPQFSSTGFLGSKPGISWADGGAQTEQMKLTINFASTTATIFALVHLEGAINNAQNRLFSLVANGVNDTTLPSFIICYGSDGGSGSFFGYAAGFQGNGGAGDSIATNNPYLLGLTFDGANSNIWVNGSVVGSQTAFSTSLGGGAGATLALGYSGFTNQNQFTAAFAGITYKAMNTTDWGNLKTYCNTNWGTSF